MLKTKGWIHSLIPDSFLHRWRNIKSLRTLGGNDVITYVFAKPGSECRVEVGGVSVLVRKGSTDLRVAVECLEKGEFDSLANVVPEDFGGYIVDGGAYIGTASIAFSLLFPKASVLAVEADAENFSQLCKNTATFPRIRCICAALTPESGDRVALRDRGTGSWGFSVVESPRDRPNAQVVSWVQTSSIRDLGVALEDIGIVKLDIEGGEYALLTESVSGLRSVPVVVVELHEHIVPGVHTAFEAFAQDRQVWSDDGEKYFCILGR